MLRWAGSLRLHFYLSVFITAIVAASVDNNNVFQDMLQEKVKK
jgi:hypothetical protein